MFQGSPAHVSTLSSPAIKGWYPTGSPRPPPEKRSSAVSPAAFRPSAFASWASCSHRGLPPLSRSAYQARKPGPRQGFRVPRTRDTTGLGALFTPGPAVFTRPSVLSRPPLATTSSGMVLTQAFIPSPWGYCDEASMRIHWRSPVRPSPRPVAPADGTQALGLLPQASHPEQARPARRTSRRGSTSNTGLELLIWHSQPPIEKPTHIRDFASHNTSTTTDTCTPRRRNSLPRLTSGSVSTTVSGDTPQSGCEVPTTTRSHCQRPPELCKPLSTIRGEPQPRRARLWQSRGIAFTSPSRGAQDGMVGQLVGGGRDLLAD
jgi:hypothetical protein